MASTSKSCTVHSGGGRRIAVLAALCLSIVACGGTDPATIADGRPLYDRLTTVLSSASFAPPIYRSAIEAAPSTKFVVDGRESMTVSDALVIGSVQSVVGATAWSFSAGPQVEGGPNTVKRLSFNDPEGDIDVVAVTLRVERSSTADGNALPETISFGLSLPSVTSLPTLEEQLKSLGTLAVLLERNEMTPFDFDKSLYGVVGYGTFLGSVDGDVVTFGAITPSPFGFAKEVVTVDAILAGAGTIALTEQNGQITRG